MSHRKAVLSSNRRAVGAGDSRPRHGRPALRKLVALCGLGLILGGTLAQAAGPDPVGGPLRLRPTGPTMQPVQVPARVQLVAAVPGSAMGEVWAAGLSSSPLPGADRLSSAGQTVFMSHVGGGAWRVAGPPVDEDGAVVNPSIASLALASTGEGWAGSSNGELFHRRPGGLWQRDGSASALTRGAAVTSISLGEDDRGVYGYAAGSGLLLLRLDEGGWTRDAAPTQVPTSAAVPDLAAVAAATRHDAWAVSGPSTNSLMLFRREGGVWTRATTGRPMFDAPPAPVLSSDGATVNSYARGSGLAVGEGQVWVSGTMAAVDPASPLGGDRSRPFVIRLDVRSGDVTSWCPRIYQLNNQGASRTTSACDAAFPYAVSEDLPTLATFPGGRVLAVGSGLFEFDGRVWSRRPSVAGYAVSATFSSVDEGWLAGDGVSTVGAGRAADSTNNTVAHWTRHPEPVKARRWAQPSTSTFESVAVQPRGGQALAVGEDGALSRLEPGIGWDSLASPTTANLHAVAWPSPERAWAVGAGGTILRFEGESWVADPASQSASRASLFGLAFRSADDGVAVGDDGTILRWDGQRWVRDPGAAGVPRLRLAGVAAAPWGYLAVGNGGTVLESVGGEPWRSALSPSLAQRLRSDQSQRLPNLIAAASTSDGTVLVGGSRGVLLQRDPAGPVRLSDLGWIDGSIHTVAPWREGDRLRAVVSVGRGEARHNGDQLAEGSGWLMVSEGDGWRDLMHGRVRERTPEADAPVLRDGVYGLALDSGDPSRAWAVGGFPRNVRDDDGHVRFTSTSSVWRLSLDGTAPPAAPNERAAPLAAVSEESVQFAFIGDSSCASALCSTTLGSGNRGDVVLTSALQAIDRAARRGQVSFAVHGGDLRANGIPDELDGVKGLLADLPVPVFAAIGDRDLFSSMATGSQSLLRSNGYYLETFADRPAPWGTSRAAKGFESVSVAGDAAPTAGRARTHYALDRVTADGGRVRLVVLDTSVGASRIEGQNPAEDQLSWLQRVLADARLRAIPTVVVMHQPQVVPIETSVESSLVTGALTAGGATLALSSHQRTNRLVLSPTGATPGAVPIGVFGGGGSPLDSESRPELGAYHSWQLVSIDSQVAGSPVVRVRSIPVLESVALSAVSGRSVSAGSTLRFQGVARTPDVGGSHSDGANPNPDQGRATYLRFPFPRPCQLLEQPVSSGCRPADVVVPDHRFGTSDPDVALFVREDPARPGRPLRDPAGRLVSDPHSGLLCAFKPGVVEVSLESGEMAGRLPVRVAAGSGDCNPSVIAPAADPSVLGSVTAPAEARPPQPADSQPPHLLQSRTPDSALGLLATPPVPSPAPSPPGGGAGEKEEERQAATEQAEMVALEHRDRGRLHLGPAAVGVALVGLSAGAAALRRRPGVAAI